jgi:thiol-disulfide isomerase/thioredoxin
MSEEQDPRSGTSEAAPEGGAPARTSWINRGFWLGGSLGCLVPVVLILAAALWVVHLAREELGSKLETPAVPGETTLTLDWNFEPVSDTAPAFAEVRGKVVFLNVWATWCNPCRMEMPAIQNLYHKVSDNPRIAVVCVSNETRAAIRAFLTKEQLDLPVYRAPDDIPKALHTDGIPATFILDPTGKVMFSHVGAARWDDDMVVSFLDSLAVGES